VTLTRSASRVDNIRHNLVGLNMPRALEMLDATLRRIERGEIDGIEAIDDLLTKELSLRENHRIKAALRMARLPILKTLAGFDFSFQPSLDRNRIMALAELDFINAPRSSIYSICLAPAKVISPPRLRSRRFAPARASTSSRSLI
jgi:DNA replication protein DnaC